MGWSKLNEKFSHVNDILALSLITNFYTLRMITMIWWKQEIISEHIRFISEATPGGMYFGRSLFRSTQEFSDPSEINDIEWTKFYAFQLDPNTKTFSIVAVSPPDPDNVVKNLYKQNKGKGEW